MGDLMQINCPYCNNDDNFDLSSYMADMNLIECANCHKSFILKITHIPHFFIYRIENEPVNEIDLEKRTLEIKKQTLGIKIEDMELSIRSERILNSIKIKTVGDLIKYGIKNLLKIKGFGKKSFMEINEVVTDLGVF